MKKGIQNKAMLEPAATKAAAPEKIRAKQDCFVPGFGAFEMGEEIADKATIDHLWGKNPNFVEVK